jgi:hypothetical protein
MSLWLNNSSNSNTLKQSYFKNFVDVSGDVITRSNYKIKLYGADPTQAFPEFSISPSEFSFYDSSGNTTDVSTNKLLFIKDLTQNVETTLNSLTLVTTHIEDNSTNFVVVSDSSFNENVYVAGDTSLNQNLTVYGSTHLLGNVYVDSSFSLSGDLDMSYNNIDVSKISVNSIDSGEISQFS